MGLQFNGWEKIRMDGQKYSSHKKTRIEINEADGKIVFNDIVGITELQESKHVKEFSYFKRPQKGTSLDLYFIDEKGNRTDQKLKLVAPGIVECKAMANALDVLFEKHHGNPNPKQKNASRSLRAELCSTRPATPLEPNVVPAKKRLLEPKTPKSSSSKDVATQKDTVSDIPAGRSNQSITLHTNLKPKETPTILVPSTSIPPKKRNFVLSDLDAKEENKGSTKETKSEILRKAGHGDYPTKIAENQDEDFPLCFEKAPTLLKYSNTQLPSPKRSSAFKASNDNSVLQRGKPGSNVLGEVPILSISNLSDLEKKNEKTVSARLPSPIVSEYRYRELNNIGNSCYMNATMQALSVLDDFTAGIQVCLLTAGAAKLSKFFKEFTKTIGYLCQRSSSYTPAKSNTKLSSTQLECLRELFGARRSEFGTSRQQDAHEFLYLLIEMLDDDWTDYVRMAAREYPQFRQLNDRQINSSVMEKTREGKTNPTKTFVMFTEDRITCNVCQASRLTPPSFTFDLSLAPKNGASLQELFTSAYPSSLCRESFCDTCSGTSNAEKSTAVKELPSSLVLTLKRYGVSMDENRLEKLTEDVKVSRYIYTNELMTGPKILDDSLRRSSLAHADDGMPADAGGFLENDDPANSGDGTHRRQSRASCDSEDSAKFTNGTDKYFSVDDKNAIGRSVYHNPSTSLKGGGVQNSNDSPDVFADVPAEPEGSGSQSVQVVFEKVKAVNKFKPLSDPAVLSSWCDLFDIKTIKQCQFGPPVAIEKTQQPSRRHTTIGDGSCFFRAISFWICGSEAFHYAIRQEAVRFLRKNRKFEGLVEMDVDKYADIMAETNYWATEKELMIMATLLECDIITYLKGQWVTYSPIKKSSNYASRQGAIYLDNNENLHFNVVLSCASRTSIGTPKANASICRRNVDSFDWSKAAGFPVYELVAVVLHQGISVNSGHYTAYIYEGCTGTWLSCSDDDIVKVGQLLSTDSLNISEEVEIHSDDVARCASQFGN